MPKLKVDTKGAPAPSGAYSQAITAGDYMFLSGQGPFDADGALVEGSFADEVHQVVEAFDFDADGVGGLTAGGAALTGFGGFRHGLLLFRSSLLRSRLFLRLGLGRSNEPAHTQHQ